MNPSVKLLDYLIKYRVIVLLCIFLLPRHIQGSLKCTANNNTVIALSADVYPLLKVVSPPRSDDGAKLANMTCVWNITAPPGHILSIDLMVVIWSNDTGACSQGETLEIFDGPSTSSKSLFNGCSNVRASGFILSKTLMTSGRYGVVEMKTGANIANTTVLMMARFTASSLKKITCLGGVVTNLTASADSKNITSPYYLYGYPPNVSCAWRITAPPGYIVKLQVEAKLRCDLNDRLDLYDSEREERLDSLEQICSKNKLYTIHSVGLIVYIVFSSNTTYQPTYKRSFIIHYSAVLPGSTCSPSNTAEQNQNIIIRGSNEGTITSPNFPNKFPSNLDCKWKFLAPRGHVVKLYVDTININISSTRCSYKPYLRIIDGFKQLVSPLLRAVQCQYGSFDPYGLQRSFFVLSSAHKLEMHFLSPHDEVTGYGFKLNYTFESLDSSGTCGEGRQGIINLRGQGATFSSPGYEFYSTKHPKNMTCLWNITADPGYIIEINSIHSNLMMSCDSEYVNVHDGATLDSPIIGTMCHGFRNTIHYKYSSGNNVLVEMKTSSSEQRGKGFLMAYRAVKYENTDYVCSSFIRVVTIDKPTAKIASPWYPTGYPNNVYCIWRFTAPFGRLAKVTISKLHLQDSKSCTADNVKVYGGTYFFQPLHHVLCGKQQTPITTVSSDQKLMIQLKSDWIGRYSGFEAVFDSLEDVSFGDCKVQGQDNHLPLNNSNGILFSPRYPKGIPDNIKCTWVITVPEGSYVRLVFDTFDLDYTCSKKSELEIRDGSSPTSKKLGTYCGSKVPPSIISSGRQLWVRFTSTSGSSVDKGFNATYSTVSALPLSISCREQTLKKIESSSGQIASHDYPLKYGNNVLCQWRIIVSDGMRVKLTFDSFNIQKTSGCSGDFVEVFDGFSRFSESLGKFCGDGKPEPVYSSGTMMYIRFQSDKTGQYPGFKASFESTLSVRTIILIVVFTLMGVGAILSVIGWCIKNNVYTHNPAPAPPDGAASTAGSNIELTSKL